MAKTKKKGPSWASTVRPQDKKEWKKSRTVEPKGPSVPEIDDGEYFARPIAGETGVFPAKPKKGKKPAVPAIGWARIGFLVLRGEFKGTKPSLFIRITGVSESQKQFASEQLQRLGYDLSDTDPDDIPALIAQIPKDFKKSKEVCKIAVENDEYNGKAQLKVYVNDVIKGDRLPDDDEDEDEEVDESEDEEEDDVEDEVTDEEEEEEDEEEASDEDEEEDDDSDDDDDEEDDDDGDEDASSNGAPRKGRKVKRKVTK